MTSLKGNVFIRFFLEGCLDIGLCAALNILYLEEPGVYMEWETLFDVVNNVTLFLLSVAIIILPFWILWFYCKNFSKWGDEHFEEKYGAVFEGLKKDQRSSLGYPMIFTLRRFALVLVVTIGRNSLVVQICVMLFFSTTQVAYLTTYSPSEDKLGMKLDVFNEVTTVVLVDLLTVFSAGNPFKFDLEADIFFLSCLLGNLCVHLFFLTTSSVHGAKLSMKKRKAQGKGCCCSRPKVKVNDKNQPDPLVISVGKSPSKIPEASQMMSVIEEEDEHSSLPSESLNRDLQVEKENPKDMTSVPNERRSISARDSHKKLALIEISELSESVMSIREAEQMVNELAFQGPIDRSYSQHSLPNANAIDDSASNGLRPDPVLREFADQDHNLHGTNLAAFQSTL
mmetsp:Transcript_4056/g.5393  ORF Transcript_4056/g.5393 Transcript_4056/m.5393 type:complete len:397 (+) Transcript_4056:1458-2648(+)|eukprot:CAMPEP_0185575222 /NCGR_PEP_ID=MMETSP0434-20130131/6474_1 /TAXON_ID=626734 ORGANISM="Favella taraikaensis, Strain Fe Narragansett Bay" /NCGR_SAMPLE_ID=MMETSP0434 /ASSEMBLY_ACC=CAM_ASM_000379 /LENGTH=396 /DNA_ID=CAMNT_0028192035 /DNA_START=1452 /DNA_END=2642 /DNA_ORIENTATION=+